MTINCRAKGSMYSSGAKGSIICNVFDTKCVNCEPYNAKVACYGFFSGTKSSGQSTGSGKNFPLCHQLEGDNGGSVGPACSTGVSHPFQGRSSPSAPSSTLPVCGRSDEPFTSGSHLVNKERSGGDSGSFRVGERFLFEPFLSTQAGRSDEASYQPQSPQPLGTSTALQDGRDSYATRDCSTGRLAGEIGLEGCVLHSPNRSGTPEVPSICGGRNPISVYVSPIRSVLRSLGIHQGSKTGRCIPKKFRSSPYCLYRRYAGDREIPSRGCRSRGGTECSVRGSGFRYQQGEVHNNSISTDRVPGSAGGYFHYDPEPPRSQDQDDSGRSNSASSTGQYQCSKGSSVYWETKRCSPGSVPSSPVLSTPAERPSRGPGQGQSELRILTPTLSGISRGNSMVAGAPDTVEWSNLAETSPADGDSVRCLPDRVGGCLQGSSDRGSMVSRGTEDAHQLLRTDRSNASSAGFCQESTRSVNSIAAGQPNSCGLYQPPGWHCIPATSAVGKSTMALGSSAGHNAVSPTYSRGDQSSGRCRVQSNRGSPRLEAVTISFSENQCHMGSTGGGSVCVTPVLSAEPVLQLEARSASRSNRCFSTGLGPSEGLCQPPLVSDRESSQASESPTGSGGSSGPSVDGSAMVSSSSGDALGLSSVDTSLAGSFSHDLQLSGNEFSAPASRMAYLREKFAHQNLSGTARDLLLASWRTKSNKTYDSHFKKWLCWCSARGSDPISGPVSEIANFLAHLHKEGYQSSSLNVFRSAISSVHDKVDGVEVGKHPTITRLLKGAFHERPPLPRYSSTWDVNAVLQYLKSLGPTSGLTLKQLTYKLVMLLALTRPSRSADLSSLSLARRRFCPEGVTFLPATLAKQSRQGKPLVEFFFPCFSHDENLCPVRTLRQYETVTSSLRSEDQQGLFLAIVKPHKQVSSCTIARWLKCVLGDAGIDINMFTAHSVRGASSSAAAMAGVTTHDILKAADWSTDSVFRRFYYRPMHSSIFGDAVLSSGNS